MEWMVVTVVGVIWTVVTVMAEPAGEERKSLL